MDRRQAPELTDEIYKQIEAFQDASADAVDAENRGRTVALKAQRAGHAYNKLEERERELENEKRGLGEIVQAAREAQMRAQQTVDGLKATIDSLPSFGLSTS